MFYRDTMHRFFCESKLRNKHPSRPLHESSRRRSLYPSLSVVVRFFSMVGRLRHLPVPP